MFFFLKAVADKLNDYRVITIGEPPKPNFPPRKLTVEDTNAFHLVMTNNDVIVLKNSLPFSGFRFFFFFLG